MSQPTSLPAAAKHGRGTPHTRGSATTAEGIAGERALRAARSGSPALARATQAARRLRSAARADARAD
jgi:hypothetical protein